MGSSRGRRNNEGESFLEGKLLIALPGMEDERFAQTVIYICAHSAKGAMGIVINKPIPGLSFTELMKQLQIDIQPISDNVPILYGGPVETGRGFVLHSGDYEGSDSTLPVSEDISLEAMTPFAAGRVISSAASAAPSSPRPTSSRSRKQITRWVPECIE